MLQTVGSIGYDATTVGVVIGRAGVSRRAFELEFAGKEDCYLAAFDSTVEEVTARLLDATGDDIGWLSKFRKGLGCLLEFLDSEPDVARALFAETHTGRPLTHDRWRRLLDQAAQFVDAARLEPEAESPPDIAANAVVSGIYGVIRARLQVSPESSVRDLLPSLLYYAVLPFFGTDAARTEKLAARKEQL